MQVSSSKVRRIKRQYRIQMAAFLGLLGIAFMLMFMVNNMLLSTVLAFVIYYLFGPAVNRLERSGLNRTLAITILFIVGGFVFTILLTSFYPIISAQVATLRSEIPKYITGTTNLIKNVESQLAFMSEIFENLNLIEQTEDYLSELTKSIFEDLPLVLSQSVTVTLLAPFFAFFMLKDGPTLAKRFFGLVPNNLFEASLHLRHQINSQLGAFIRARILEAALVGGIVWIGLWVMNFPFAPILALFAALANLIPYVGPIIGILPAIIIAIINGYSFLGTLAVSIPYIIAQVIDIFFIIPIVVAKIVDLHPVTVIVSFIVGAELLGVLGMVIAIPVASVLKVTIFNVYRHLVEFRN